MCSMRVRKFTGLIRSHVFPFSSVVEIQNFPLLLNPPRHLRVQSLPIGVVQAGNAEVLSLYEPQ
jgi:hypothetical protein